MWDIILVIVLLRGVQVVQIYSDPDTRYQTVAACEAGAAKLMAAYPLPEGLRGVVACVNVAE